MSGRLVRRTWAMRRLPHIVVLFFILLNDIKISTYSTTHMWSHSSRCNPAVTFVCCFWFSPLEGEFLLPCDAPFINPCLLCCRSPSSSSSGGDETKWERGKDREIEIHTTEHFSRLCIPKGNNGGGSLLTCVGIKGERGEWFRPTSCRWELWFVAAAGWGLTMAVSLWEMRSPRAPWERLTRAQGGTR